MTINAANWVGENTSTVGSGDITLGGAIAGFARFNVIGNGEIYYTIQDGLAKETGIGTLVGDVLSRTKITATIDKDGVYSTTPTPLDLSGNAQVFGTINADFMKHIYESVDTVEESAILAQQSATSANQSKVDAEASKTAAVAAAATASSSANQAGVSAQGAVQAQSAAADSATAALASQNAAKSSETNSANSAAAALVSEGKAKTSETNSKASETAAASSASDSNASKVAAASSATQASTSATNAANSATAASNSASTASTKASDASTSATQAAASATAADTSKTAAKTSETNAKASEVAAKGYSDSLANAGNFLARGEFPAGVNLNTYGPTSDKQGIWTKSTTTGATIANGFPEDAASGKLESYIGGAFGGMQTYTVSNGNVYVRSLTAAWNGTNGPWGAWILSGKKPINDLGIGLTSLPWASSNTFDWQQVDFFVGMVTNTQYQQWSNAPALTGTIPVATSRCYIEVMAGYQTGYTVNVAVYRSATAIDFYSIAVTGDKGSRTFKVNKFINDDDREILNSWTARNVLATLPAGISLGGSIKSALTVNGTEHSYASFENMYSSPNVYSSARLRAGLGANYADFLFTSDKRLLMPPGGELSAISGDLIVGSSFGKRWLSQASFDSLYSANRSLGLYFEQMNVAGVGYLYPFLSAKIYWAGHYGGVFTHSLWCNLPDPLYNLTWTYESGASKSWSFNAGTGNASAPGNWQSGSDIRHKNNLKIVENALEAVCSWRGVTYDKKDGIREVGIIAQDVEKDCPEAITEERREFSDGTVIEDFKYLNVAGVSAAFHTEAIKILRDQIISLREELESLKAVVASQNK